MALLKLSHLFFVFLWLAGLITVSWLFAHQRKASRELAGLLKRLYLSLQLPSMILAIGTGVLLFVLKGIGFKVPWIHLKLTCVLLLVVWDLILGWRIVRLRAPQQRLGWLLLHCGVLLSLIGILIAIYLIKS